MNAQLADVKSCLEKDLMVFRLAFIWTCLGLNPFNPDSISISPGPGLVLDLPVAVRFKLKCRVEENTKIPNNLHRFNTYTPSVSTEKSDILVIWDLGSTSKTSVSSPFSIKKLEIHDELSLGSVEEFTLTYSITEYHQHNNEC